MSFITSIGQYFTFHQQKDSNQESDPFSFEVPEIVYIPNFDADYLSVAQKDSYASYIEKAREISKEISFLNPVKKFNIYSLITMAAEVILLEKGIDLLIGRNFSGGPINIKDKVIVGVAGVIIAESYARNFFAAIHDQRNAEQVSTRVAALQKELNSSEFSDSELTKGLQQVTKGEERALTEIKNSAIRTKALCITEIGSNALLVLGVLFASSESTFGSSVIRLGVLGVLATKVIIATVSLGIWDLFKGYENSEAKAFQDPDYLKKILKSLETRLGDYRVIG